METTSNKGVILATIGGTCLVLIAILASNYVPLLTDSGDNAATPQNTNPPTRNMVADTITETNDDVEAWQRTVLDYNSGNRQITTSANTDTPQADPSATLTGRMGIAMLEEALLNDQQNRDTATTEAAINRIVEDVMRETRGEMYDLDDLTVVEPTDEAIVQYFNQAAALILATENPDAENVIRLFERAVETGDTGAYAALEAKADQFADLRDAYLELEVPTRVYKTHLHMVNVFHILHQGLTDMTLAEEDPLRAYVRMERFPDDVSGLNYALISMGMHVLENEAFTADDDAVYFFSYIPELSRAI